MEIAYKIKPMKPFGVLISPQKDSAPVRDLPINELRDLTRQHSLILVRGFSAFSTVDTFANYCDQWGEVSIWPFGKILELTEKKNPQDHIFDNNYVPLHWDGMYRQQVPEFQIFQCVAAPDSDQGGCTTFSNTTEALFFATDDMRELWNKTTGVYHRKMEFYDSKTIAPIITKHPVNGRPVIRYNEPPKDGDKNFVNHPDIEFRGLTSSELTELHQSLRKALYNPQNFYAHTWQTNDVIIADNYALLHGRDAFTTGASRHLRRAHILGEPPLENPHLVSYT